ncbi:MAG TPA: hypothetical protein VF815_11845 [Myxococcaceae bacterium]|jgi:hypothetical protein
MLAVLWILQMGQRLCVRAAWLLLLPNCATGTMTLVEGSVGPEHFHFVTVVRQQGEAPGGWRAACIHIPLSRTTGESFLCRMGVEMPIKTEADGLLSTPLAQRISADCANLAAQIALGAVTPATPLGVACESFKEHYRVFLNNAVSGSRVRTLCHEKTSPVIVGG